MHCSIVNEKELPIHYSTIADVFHDVFCDVYLRSFKVLHFLWDHVVIETPIKHTSFSTWFDSSRRQICCVKTSTKNG